MAAAGWRSRGYFILQQKIACNSLVIKRIGHLRSNTLGLSIFFTILGWISNPVTSIGMCHVSP